MRWHLTLYCATTLKRAARDADVVELLKMLSALNAAKNKRFASMGDLTSLEASPKLGNELPTTRRPTAHSLAARTHTWNQQSNRYVYY